MEVPLKRDWLDGVEVAPGRIVLLENCRFNKGEKKNDEALGEENGGAVRRLRERRVRHGASRRGDDARHRAVRARWPAPARCMAAEIEALGRALENPARPLVAIVGGSKVSTKLTILAALAEKVDQLIVGGGIANTFLLAAGGQIGKSLAEPELVRRSAQDQCGAGGKGRRRCRCPSTSSCAKELSRRRARAEVKRSSEVADDDLILDIGPQSAQRARGGCSQTRARSSGTARSACSSSTSSAAGTQDLAEAIARLARRFRSRAAATRSRRSRSIGVADSISYISTGGGAFLEFLEGKKLPAVEILEQRAAASLDDRCTPHQDRRHTRTRLERRQSRSSA